MPQEEILLGAEGSKLLVGKELMRICQTLFRHIAFQSSFRPVYSDIERNRPMQLCGSTIGNRVGETRNRVGETNGIRFDRNLPPTSHQLRIRT